MSPRSQHQNQPRAAPKESHACPGRIPALPTPKGMSNTCFVTSSPLIEIVWIPDSCYQQCHEQCKQQRTEYFSQRIRCSTVGKSQANCRCQGKKQGEETTYPT